MNLDKIVIVLDRPEESRNIGAVCRAMANCDIKCLRIVGSMQDIDDTRVRILAIHADTIWNNVSFFNSITEATSDCALSAGTTRRRGKNRKGKLLLPEEFSAIADKVTSNCLTPDKGGKVAIVFGNERTGLTDDEMAECTEGVTIPSSLEFASLNLSHAVQIICYHLFRTKRNISQSYTPLTLSRIDQIVSNITTNLHKIGFFKINGRKDMEQFWRMILSRAALSEKEAKYIEKTFNKIAGLINKNRVDIDE